MAADHPPTMRNGTQAVRIALPTLILAGLAATAMHLDAPPQLTEPAPVSLLTTGAELPSSDAESFYPEDVELAASLTAPIASDPTVAISAATGLPDTATGLPNTTTGSPTPNLTADGLDQISDGCAQVNEFAITITAGNLACDTVAGVAKQYTDAVLGQQLGTSLMWSGSGWNCIRNFDETGKLWNAHGLVCTSGANSFLLVSE